MRRAIVVCLPLLIVAQAGTTQGLEVKAAARYVPGVTWNADSVIKADFTCRGSKQTAILGDSPTDVVIAVFLNGLDHRPEVLRFTFPRGSTKLEAENLDDDGGAGFRRSKTCKGLSLDDGETDPIHIYWNHESARFNFWRN